jgi:hypothetical protein
LGAEVVEFDLIGHTAKYIIILPTTTSVKMGYGNGQGFFFPGCKVMEGLTLIGVFLEGTTLTC